MWYRWKCRDCSKVFHARNPMKSSRKRWDQWDQTCPDCGSKVIAPYDGRPLGIAYLGGWNKPYNGTWYHFFMSNCKKGETITACGKKRMVAHSGRGFVGHLSRERCPKCEEVVNQWHCEYDAWSNRSGIKETRVDV